MDDLIVKTDVVYDEKRHLLTDLYYVANRPNQAAIIDVHGGGWFRGDKAKDADLATRLVQAGYFVMVPNYRFTPEAYYPAPLVDMDAAYGWLKSAPYPFDHERIAAVGSSAGGNMTVELAIKYGIPAVSLSGILDIDQWLAGHQEVVADEGNTSDFNQKASAQINQDGQNDAFYKWFVTNYFNQRTDQYVAATPFHRVTHQTGPLYLGNALNEFVPNSGVLTMARVLTENQVPFELHLVAGTQHAKGYLDQVFDSMVVFLKQYL